MYDCMLFNLFMGFYPSQNQDNNLQHLFKKTVIRGEGGGVEVVGEL